MRIHSKPQYKEVLFSSTGSIASFGLGSGNACTATSRTALGMSGTPAKLVLEYLALSDGADVAVVNAAVLDAAKLQRSTTTAARAKIMIDNV
mmetsp:Transcript_105356/g.204021  ORF Transcript_105356/g.204021 Transcript_105356/m.204021 type:complete len:92 (+) Transcript_105356:120-395(+)